MPNYKNIHRGIMKITIVVSIAKKSKTNEQCKNEYKLFTSTRNNVHGVKQMCETAVANEWRNGFVQ